MTEIDEIGRLRRGLIRAGIRIRHLQAELKRILVPSNIYATVVSVIEPDSKIDEVNYSHLPLGTIVHIIKSGQHPELVGKVGFVISETDKNGEIIVGFEDGIEANFGVGLPKKRNSDREIEVVPVDQRKVIISLGGKLLELEYPKELMVRSGDTVRIMQETNQIIEIVNLKDKTGPTAVVQKLISPRRCSVNVRNANLVVLTGQFAGFLEAGQRVVIDPSLSVIIDNLGYEDEQFKLAQAPKITWDDIGGQVLAKEILREAVELPYKRPDLYKFYKQKPIKGALIIGPPGCGKTMLAEAVASALAEQYGKKGSIPSGFIYVKGPEILRKWVGDPEELVREIFAQARKHEAKFGYPAVIFFDECEAIFRKRGQGISTDVTDTIVNMTLTEMSGLEDSGAIVLLATNREDILDPAIIRHGRIDEKIYVGRPDQKTAEDIFKIWLKDQPFDGGVTAEEMARYAAEEMYSEKYVLYEIEFKDGEKKNFTLRSISSGALIHHGIVNKAARLAIKRDEKDNSLTGLRKDDIKEAIRLVFDQERLVEHEDALNEVFCDLKDKIAGIEKSHQAVA